MHQHFVVLEQTAHTQKLSTVGTIGKRKQNVFKAFLKTLGLSKSEKLIQKMQQNIGNVTCKTSMRTIQTPLNKKVNKADACLAQHLKTERPSTFVTYVINLQVRSMLSLNVGNFLGMKKTLG